MANAKTLLIGGVLGILSTLSGLGLVRAECSQGSFEAAQADAYEGNARGDSCEVIELQNGTFEAQCDGEAFPAWVAACSDWVETALDCSDLSPEACDDAMGQMYEACMVIAVNTGAVR